MSYTGSNLSAPISPPYDMQFPNAIQGRWPFKINIRRVLLLPENMQTMQMQWLKCMTHILHVFETPVTVNPQQNISKTLNSSRIPEKYLTFTFGETIFTFGERTFTLGEIMFTFGDFRRFSDYWKLFFVAGGFFGLRGSGAPVAVFENI